jgi:hypothetical protein
MAWFPWVAMPTRSQTPDELIDWLRYSAIQFGAPVRFIDSIEELYAFSVQDERIEELEGKLSDAEYVIGRIREEAGASISAEARIEAIQDILDED